MLLYHAGTITLAFIFKIIVKKEIEKLAILLYYRKNE